MKTTRYAMTKLLVFLLLFIWIIIAGCAEERSCTYPFLHSVHFCSDDSSINNGSCGFNTLSLTVATPLYTAAFAVNQFGSGAACGECYKITNLINGKYTTVVITDLCPLMANNAPNSICSTGNAIDLSSQAFKDLEIQEGIYGGSISAVRVLCPQEQSRYVAVYLEAKIGDYIQIVPSHLTTGVSSIDFRLSLAASWISMRKTMNAIRFDNSGNGIPGGSTVYLRITSEAGQQIHCSFPFDSSAQGNLVSLTFQSQLKQFDSLGCMPNSIPSRKPSRAPTQKPRALDDFCDLRPKAPIPKPIAPKPTPAMPKPKPIAPKPAAAMPKPKPIAPKPAPAIPRPKPQ